MLGKPGMEGIVGVLSLGTVDVMLGKVGVVRRGAVGVVVWSAGGDVTEGVVVAGTVVWGAAVVFVG